MLVRERQKVDPTHEDVLSVFQALHAHDVNLRLHIYQNRYYFLARLNPSHYYHTPQEIPYHKQWLEAKPMYDMINTFWIHIYLAKRASIVHGGDVIPGVYTPEA